MSEELRETVEILRIGSEYAIQLAGITKEALQALFAIGNSFYMERSGRVDFKSVLKNCAQKGTSPVPLAFPSEDEAILSKAEAMLKDMNVQFARMPDFIQGDYETQYLVSSDQAHFFQIIANRIFEDELKRIERNGGSENDLTIKQATCRVLEGNEYMDCVPNENLTQAKEEAINNLSSMRTEDSQLVSPNMQADSKKKFLMSNREEQTRNNPDFERISIDKQSLLQKEDDEYVYFRIPGTNGKEYTRIRQGDLIRSDAQSYTFAVHKKEYLSIFDRNGNFEKNYPAETFLRFFSEPKERYSQTSYSQTHRRAQSQMQRPRLSQKKPTGRRR